MSALEIVEEIPKLSEQELRLVTEIIEDAEDIADALKVLADPEEKYISLDEMIRKHGLRNGKLIFHKQQKNNFLSFLMSVRQGLLLT